LPPLGNNADDRNEEIIMNAAVLVLMEWIVMVAGCWSWPSSPWHCLSTYYLSVGMVYVENVMNDVIDGRRWDGGWSWREMLGDAIDRSTAISDSTFL